MKNIQNLSELIDVKFIIAVIGMAIIIIGMIAVLSLIVISFQKRRDAVAVSLPDISANGQIEDLEPAFKENEELTIELIVDNEDVVKNSKIVNDEKHFLTALSYEAKQCFSEDNSTKIEMPEVGEIDYEKIKEEKKKEKQEERDNYFKEIAEADREEENLYPQNMNSELQG